MMAEALIQADPNHASAYRTNARVLGTRLHELDESLRESTAGLENDRSYIVFHDAYAPFEDRYGLGSSGSLLPGSAHGHEHGPSAHRLAELREILLEGNTEVACVFIEPAFNPASAHTLVEGTSVKVVTIDPLGTDIPPSPDAYFLLMENIAESFRECFATQ